MHRHSSRIHPALVVVLALVGLVGPASGQPAPSPFAPLGSSPVPPENPRTQAKVDLGFALFWDEQLSRTGTVACGSCHMPRAGGSDPRLPAGVANSRHPGPDNVFGTADDSIGTAGVPAGSLPVVALICGMVGVPPEGIGLILGVDRFLDMCRTTLNVTGDLMLATVVSKGEEETQAA